MEVKTAAPGRVLCLFFWQQQQFSDTGFSHPDPERLSWSEPGKLCVQDSPELQPLSWTLWKESPPHLTLYPDSEEELPQQALVPAFDDLAGP